jgi:hypothetical protein
MGVMHALGSGLAGACALTLLHESARRVVPDAPRADVLGMRAIAKIMRSAGQEPPPDRELHKAALVGDIISNSLYYSLVAAGGGRHTWAIGSALGVAAGVGAVTLPGPLGLGTKPSARTPATAAMTVGWYLAGGLAAAAAYRLLRGSRR